MLVSLIADAYAIGRYCIHQTTKPYARGAKRPKLVPLSKRSLLIFLNPVFLNMSEAIKAGVPLSNNIQYK